MDRLIFAFFQSLTKFKFVFYISSLYAKKMRKIISRNNSVWFPWKFYEKNFNREKPRSRYLDVFLPILKMVKARSAMDG